MIGLVAAVTVFLVPCIASAANGLQDAERRAAEPLIGDLRSRLDDINATDGQSIESLVLDWNRVLLSGVVPQPTLPASNRELQVSPTSLTQLHPRQRCGCKDGGLCCADQNNFLGCCPVGYACCSNLADGTMACCEATKICCSSACCEADQICSPNGCADPTAWVTETVTSTSISVIVSIVTGYPTWTSTIFSTSLQSVTATRQLAATSTEWVTYTMVNTQSIALTLQTTPSSETLPQRDGSKPKVTVTLRARSSLDDLASALIARGIEVARDDMMTLTNWTTQWMIHLSTSTQWLLSWQTALVTTIFTSQVTVATVLGAEAVVTSTTTVTAVPVPLAAHGNQSVASGRIAGAITGAALGAVALGALAAMLAYRRRKRKEVVMESPVLPRLYSIGPPKLIMSTMGLEGEFSDIPLTPYARGCTLQEPSPISPLDDGSGGYSAWPRNSDERWHLSELYYSRYEQDLNLPELAGKQIGRCGVLSPDEFRSVTQDASQVD